ncbi:hypothetical protein [Virgibacillus ainsalahensis]
MDKMYDFTSKIENLAFSLFLEAVRIGKSKLEGAGNENQKTNKAA